MNVTKITLEATVQYFPRRDLAPAGGQYSVLVLAVQRAVPPRALVAGQRFTADELAQKNQNPESGAL